MTAQKYRRRASTSASSQMASGRTLTVARYPAVHREWADALQLL